MKHQTGKNPRESRTVRDLKVRPKALALAVAACFSTAVWANPTNPVVVHGTASFQQAGNILNVTNSHNAIINWGSFSIGVNELTRFIQPSALSAVLNRVTGGDPSAILGALQSNGRVFLLNPNGIVFGAGAQIDVAGLVASTLNLSNADFLAGRMNFTGGANAGSLVNQGAINATGGPVYLVGSAVTNQGIITNPGGEIVLAAGNSVELVNPGTPNLRVEIQASSNEARNLGSIVADAGRIGIYAGLIKQGGVINADSAVAEGGRIMLRSTKRTDIEAGSVTSARGSTGGQILVLSGMQEGVTDVQGAVDASSNSPTAPGNGGFIETSGGQILIGSSVAINTAGANGGANGIWLIDPIFNFNIGGPDANITAATLSSALNANSVVIATASSSADYYGGAYYAPAPTPSPIPAGNGDIFVNDSVSWSSAYSLTLTAQRNVIVNNSITNTGTGGINLYAGWDGSSTPSSPILSNQGMIALNNSLATAGTVQLWARTHINQNTIGSISAANLKAVSDTASVTLNSAANNVGTIAGSAIGQFAFSNSSANNLTVGSAGGVNGITVNGTSPGLHANATLSQTGGGQLAVSQPINVTGADGVEGAGGNATIQLTSSGGITVSSQLLATGGGGGSSYNGFSGGSAVVNLNNTGSMTSIVTNPGSDLYADGGLGGTSSGGVGGAGGMASVSVTSAGGLVLNGELNAWGGTGGSSSYSANGGPGGNAEITTSSAGSTQLAGLVRVDGGGGGSAMSSTSGNGGHASLVMNSTGAMTLASGTEIFVEGGRAGLADYGIGGSGGNALLTLTAGGNLALSGASLTLESGPAGSSYYSNSTGTTGRAEIKLTSNGGSLSVSNATIFADGGESQSGSAPVGFPALIELKSAGNLTVSQSDLEVYGATIGYAASGSEGGGSVISLVSTGGSITVDGSSLRSYAGNAYWNSSVSGGNGLIGISAAANVTVSNSSYIYASSGDGGEGGAGGGSVVLVSADGNLSLTGYSSLYAYGGNTADYSFLNTGQGGGGAITLVAGGPIVVDGSEGYAYGGYGGATRGNAAINVIGLGGSIAMTNSSSFYVTSDRFKEGLSSIALAAAGSVSLNGDSSLNASNGGVVGIGGGGITIDSSSVSGSGGVSLSSTGDISALNYASISSGANLNITAIGSLSVSSSSNLYGYPDVNLNIGGNVNLGNMGRVEAGSPSTINLYFPNGSSSGFFVNGVQGITDDGSGAGFFVLGAPAVVGTNMFVTYGTPATVTNAPVDNLIVALTQSTKPPEGQQSTGAKNEDEDLKKNAKKDAPVCR